MEWEFLLETALSNGLFVVGVILCCIVFATVILLTMRLLEKGGVWTLIGALCSFFILMTGATTWFEYHRKVDLHRWEQQRCPCSELEHE